MSQERDFDIAPLYTVDPADPPDVVYFPVRHYSPTSAKLLWELADELPITAVLVEGPADFNERVDELMLDGHKLPIALYSYVRLSDDTKRSAFYPYCEYAPEWQALRLARDRDVPFRFIDLPWEAMALETEREHRYSDEHFRHNPWPEILCDRMNVADFDELWDVFFELEPDLDWRTYLRRCHEFCYQLRVFGAPEVPENIAREACMTANIEGAVEELGGTVLVVTGGFHSAGLYARRHNIELEHFEIRQAPTRLSPDQAPDTDDQPPRLDPDVIEMVKAQTTEPPTVVESGITLTPFTYERIDKLSGYASGVHGPAFYQYVWERRRADEPLTCSTFLSDIVERLRERGQMASTADLIGITSTARALAALRGREEIWRFDLLDAISSAIVKEAEDAEYEHPVLQVARDVLRGERRGRVDERAPLPPLVANVRKTLEELDLLPTSDREQPIYLDLEEERGRLRSRALHQTRVLEIAGFGFVGGTDFVAREDLSRVWEEWTKSWSPEFEATLIENAVYGTDLREAATARILERAQTIEKDAEKAAVIAIDAVLMGVGSVAASLFDKLEAIVRADGDFFKVSVALGHVLYLACYDEVLGARGDARLADLLREVYLRALWLFESLGTVRDRDTELVSSIKSLIDCFRRCYADDPDDRAELTAIFERTGADDEQSPLARGAAMGALYALDALQIDRVLATLRSFLDPVDVGDYLVGFFSLAREAAQKDARLLALVDQLVCELAEQEFLEMLPGLRLAFTFFTPLEKHTLVDALFGDRARSSDARVSEADILEAAALDARMRQAAQLHGLRGFPDELPPAEPAPTPDSEPEPEAEPPTSSDSVAAKDEVSDSADLTPEERRERWRLILGAASEDSLGGSGGDSARRGRLLSYLYDREYGPSRNVRGTPGEGRGSLDPSQLTVPDWINGVHELFPRRTIERLEKDALDRYKIEELVTRPDVLSRAQPNPTLLKAVLRTKHLMNREVLEIARRLVRQVVDALMEKLARDIKQPFSGALDRRRRSFLKVAKNFDALETIRRNLKYYDPQRRQLVIKDPYFYSRIRRQVDRWQVIIVVDQSGSMLDSVIHSAVTASIFAGIQTIKSHLVAFDTEIIDLSGDAQDPVETLMRVQLGGGTDIAKALLYAASLVENPARTIVVLITDFEEGGPLQHLLGATRELTESGVTLLGLAALDGRANPQYNREIATKMAQLGAHVGAMTPGELAEWVAEKVR